MPLYEYECKKCGSCFEELVFNSSEKVACPECSSKRVSRLMSKCAFKSGGKFVSTSDKSDCSGCTSSNCSSCH